MMKRKYFLFIICIPIFLFGDESFIDSKYPADISFMVADFKYSKEKGVKFCEVQHGILSTYYGDCFLNGSPGVVPTRFLDLLTKYQNRFWTIQCRSGAKELQDLIKNSPEWSVESDFRRLERSSDFQERANMPLYDPYDLRGYHGAVFVWQEDLKYDPSFREKYPGILVLDAATHPFWKDKYKMTQLFTKNERLASFKPKWGLYSKVYTPDLADKIISEIDGDIFVIKPRGAFLGNGVIIVYKKNLDATLRYILRSSSSRMRNPDHAYNYWNRDPFDSFLVEEFVESDKVRVPHSGNQVFQPTMRAVFVLTYHKQKIKVNILQTYWIIPPHPLSESATLNGWYESHSHPYNCCGVDPETQIEVKKQLKEALTLLYAEMLKR